MLAMMPDSSSTAQDWHFNPPREVLQSRLFAAGGFLVVAGLFDEQTLQGMLTEASIARPEGLRGCVADSDETQGRGGSPARAFRSGPGGALHAGLHGCQQMVDTLGRLC